MLPSVVEYLYDELDGVSDLMSPVQPLLTQAVTDDDHSKRNGKEQNCLIPYLSITKYRIISHRPYPICLAQ